MSAVCILGCWRLRRNCYFILQHRLELEFPSSMSKFKSSLMPCNCLSHFKKNDWATSPHDYVVCVTQRVRGHGRCKPGKLTTHERLQSEFSSGRRRESGGAYTVSTFLLLWESYCVGYLCCTVLQLSVSTTRDSLMCVSVQERRMYAVAVPCRLSRLPLLFAGPKYLFKLWIQRSYWRGPICCVYCHCRGINCVHVQCRFWAGAYQSC